jgi:uncharacterized membrane protein YGL010W
MSNLQALRELEEEQHYLAIEVVINVVAFAIIGLVELNLVKEIATCTTNTWINSELAIGILGFILGFCAVRTFSSIKSLLSINKQVYAAEKTLNSEEEP